VKCTTGNDGRFSINAESTDKLVFGHIRFATREIAVNSKNNIVVHMVKGSLKEPDAVIVTALCIKRQERILVCAATSVKTDELATNRL
jgi:hypothetical protein